MALPEDRSIAVGKFPAKVRGFVDPQAPKRLRMMLARGMVPVKPVVQVCALYQLSLDSDEEISTAAVDTVRRLPIPAVVGVARERVMDVVLDWLATTFSHSAEVLEALIQNKRTDVDTLARVAREARDEELLEALARNQQRLLQSGHLVAAIYLNRATRASTADRVVDFAARNDVDLSMIPNSEAVLAALRAAPVERRTVDEEEAMDAAFREVNEAFAEDVADDLDVDLDLGLDEELPRADHDAPKQEEAPKKNRSAAGRIREMNAAQKVRLANMGNKTERAILIHDTNKMIARAVIRSPAVTEAEAALYARDKTLLEEVIAYIANNRKWVRKYRMKKILILNPKTSYTTALNFLSYLRASDLRNVARSRDVSGQLRKAANALIRKRSG